MIKTPLFDKLMSAYFHEDWDLDHDSEEGVLARFLESFSAIDLANEISVILNEFDTESRLEHYTTERKWPDIGPNENETYRQWLLRWQEALRS